MEEAVTIIFAQRKLHDLHTGSHALEGIWHWMKWRQQRAFLHLCQLLIIYLYICTQQHIL